MRLVLVIQCIIGLQSQSIGFTNDFYQADIPTGEPVFIEILKDFSSTVGYCDIFIRLNKILYGQSKATWLWYEKL